MLDQRVGRVYRDLQLAAGGFGDVVDELTNVLDLEVAIGLGRGHVPFDLGVRETGGKQRSRGECGASQVTARRCVHVDPLE